MIIHEMHLFNNGYGSVHNAATTIYNRFRQFVLQFVKVM